MEYPFARGKIICSVLVTAAVLTACYPARRPHPALFARIEGVSGRFVPGQIVHSQTGEVLSFYRLIDSLASKRLVFVGESHDNPEHHLIEVQILQALMEHQPGVDVGVEFFQSSFQPVIDQYMGGKISEQEFLKLVHWQRSWGFYYHFYRPIIRLIRHRSGNLLAINAPRRIVRKIARSGLDSLDPDERDHLAEDIDLTDKGHREYVRRVYKGHSHKRLRSFDYFYQAQCVWEDTMAENIARYLRRSPSRKMVILCGNGHIIYKFGIPDRTLKRLSVSMATLFLYPLGETPTDKIDKSIADYIWLTGG